MVFRTCTQKLCFHQRFDYFMMFRKQKKNTQLMQHPFRTCKVGLYMGVESYIPSVVARCSFVIDQSRETGILLSLVS